MISLEQRALVVVMHAWALLPAIKDKGLFLTEIRLDDLGAKHGCFDPATGAITLSARLFWGDTADQLMTIDIHGDTPAGCEPWCARALHTTIHELAHALGYTFSLDTSTDWLALSAWAHTDEDRQDTGRYRERRPGWGTYDSGWRYQQGSWFTRPYASASPAEDFADCVTHMALGWTDGFLSSASGRRKLQYLRRTLWREPGTASVVAASGRFQAKLRALGVAV